MTNSSLRRVIAFLPCVLGACAHQLDSYPEQLGSDDAPVRGSSAAGAAGSGPGTVSPPGGTGGAATHVGFAGMPDVGSPRGGTASGGGAGVSGAGRGGTEIGGGTGEAGGGGAKAGAGGAAGPSAAGAASAGADDGGAPPEGGKCAETPNWSARKYDAGERVQSAGKLYECKPFPYVGWCGLDAYEPGKGQAWSDAWTLLGSC